ncbi:MAG: PAS domain-containing protein [Planctomycetes bacterium]|nr:PAS domain-containing protein [Planctomycetota bacterium]
MVLLVLLLWEFDHTTLAAWAGIAGCVMLGAVHTHTIARAKTAAEETERLRQVVGDLQVRLQRLDGALDGTGEGVLVVDTQGHLVAGNSAAAGLLQRPIAASIGQRFADVAPWPRLAEAVRQSLLTGAPHTFELLDDRDRERKRTLDVHVQAVPGVGVVIGIDDLSRLRQLESHRRDFVANVSHELKTPLAAILGFVETLIDDPAMAADTRQRFLGKIARQSERLAALVGDLLTLSRLDEERDALLPAEPTDLAAIVRETLRDLHALAERKRLRIVGELTERPVPIRGEPESLRQVVGNLIDNAIKYTPEGGAVTVRVLARDAAVRLEVTDTGIGLSDEDKERVFERFYRVDKARSRELGGTGLGLAIAKNVVRALHGEIGVDSVLGGGSTFWVTLPLASGA